MAKSERNIAESALASVLKADEPLDTDHGYSFRSDARATAAREFPVHVGVDCAKTFHKLVARGPDGRRRVAFRVDVSREGFIAADRYLRTAFPRIPRRRVLIGLEIAGNYGTTFAHYLLAQGYAIVGVLPTVTKRTREAEDNSPRKDDDKDAAQVCRLVGAGLYSPYTPLSPAVAALRHAAIERRHLTRDASRLRSRLRSILDVTWPEFQVLFVNLEKRTPRELLSAWPLPSDVASLNLRTLRRLVRTLSRNQLKEADADAIRQSAQRTIGVTLAPDACRSQVRRLLERWDAIDAQLKAIDSSLEAIVRANRVFEALLTIPEIGILSAATIIGEIGDIHRYESPRQVLKMAGLNLTRRQSGTSVLGPVRIAKRGRTGLRHQLYLLAGRWCKKNGLFRPRYEAMLARNGRRRTKTLVALSRSLVPVIYHVLATGDPFDRGEWISGRQKGSD